MPSPIWFLVALVAGVLVATTSVVALKSITESEDEIVELAEVTV